MRWPDSFGPETLRKPAPRNRFDSMAGTDVWPCGSAPNEGAGSVPSESECVLVVDSGSYDCRRARPRCGR